MCQFVELTPGIDLAVSRLVHLKDWIGLSSVLRPCQHSIGYIGDGHLKEPI